MDGMYYNNNYESNPTISTDVVAIEEVDKTTTTRSELFQDINRLDKSPALYDDLEELINNVHKLDKEVRFNDSVKKWIYGGLIFCMFIPPLFFVVILGIIVVALMNAFSPTTSKPKVEKREYSLANYDELIKKKQIAILTVELLKTFKNGYLRVDKGIDTKGFERVGLLLKKDELGPVVTSRKRAGSIWFGMKTDKIEFELSNMELIYSVREATITNFFGILARVVLNESASEDTIIVPRTSQYYTKYGKWEYDEKVDIEICNDAFNERFRVQSSTGTTSLNIGSYFMGSLIEMNKKYNNMGFAVSGNELFIAWRTDDVFFPVELDKKGEIDRLIDFSKDVIRMKELFEDNLPF